MSEKGNAKKTSIARSSLGSTQGTHVVWTNGKHSKEALVDFLACRHLKFWEII